MSNLDMLQGRNADVRYALAEAACRPMICARTRDFSIAAEPAIVPGAESDQSFQFRTVTGEKMLKPVQWDDVRAREIIATHSTLDGAALPILHALQHEFGFIPEEAIPLVASALNLSRAEVHGIVTFYHGLRRKPPGRHVLKICRAEACQSMGGAALSREFLARQGVDWGGTTRDGSLTIESVYCLGLCACSPSALYDGEPIGRLDGDKLHAIAQEARDQ